MPASPTRRTVAAPRPPDIPEARRFPLIATIAPVVVSVGLFAVTRSALTLVFALLGPVVAAATVGDSALHRRRASRREARRFTAELEAALAEIDALHSDECAALDRRHPRAHSIVRPPRGQVHSRSDSGSDDAGDLVVRLGSGPLPSSVQVDQAQHGARPSDGGRLVRLREHAAVLSSAPISSSIAHGLGIAGPDTLVRAVARGIVLQVAAASSPAATRIDAPLGAEWDWVQQLPHGVTRRGDSHAIDFISGDARLSVVVGVSIAALPRQLGVVMLVNGDGLARIAAGTSNERGDRFRPEFVGVEVAVSAAEAIARRAEHDGVTPTAASGLPDRVALAELSQQAGAEGLSAAIGVGADGPVVIDLARDGPHAIVGGTTGSGKSELLTTWVLAIAGERSPETVTFLFVDFKGGAAFDPLARLPHCVGVITDLDPAHSLRAIASLSAELRHREGVLAQHGIRSIDERTDTGEQPFPRLVVVVDEYAALVETHSTLHTTFADIAARGRSLGVHLVLCTQRPAGVVRDGIMANCALRISLRVLTAADSTAALGSGGAAALASAPIGRALVGGVGSEPSLVQVAHADRADCDAVVARWLGVPRPRAPWLPPLGDRIPVATVDGMPPMDGIPFALADLPERQAQEVAHYRPDTHGSIIVVGAAGSGKSGVLAALAAAPSVVSVDWLPSDLPRLWDALDAASSASGEPRLLLLDDADAVLAAVDDTYRDVLRDRLAGLLRSARASGVHLALTVQRVTGAVQSLAGLCGSTLILRMPNPQEHVLAGGAVADFVPDAVPGSATWRGHRVQVLDAPRERASIRPPVGTAVDVNSSGLVVVSTRPEEFARRLRAAAPMTEALVLQPGRPDFRGDAATRPASANSIRVADPETWQSHWTAFVAAQRGGDILFDGCSAAELRSLARIRDLPPPFPHGERPLWLLSSEGVLARARLPEPASQRATPD